MTDILDILYDCIRIKSNENYDIHNLCLIYYAHGYHPRRVNWTMDKLQTYRLYHSKLLEDPSYEEPFVLRNVMPTSHPIFTVLDKCIAEKTKKNESIQFLLQLYWIISVENESLTTQQVIDICTYYAFLSVYWNT